MCIYIILYLYIYIIHIHRLSKNIYSTIYSISLLQAASGWVARPSPGQKRYSKASCKTGCRILRKPPRARHLWLSVVKSQRGTGCRMSHVILHPPQKSGPGLSGFFRRPEVYQAGRSYMSGQHKVALSALNLDPPSPEKLHSPSSEARGSF